MKTLHFSSISTLLILLLISGCTKSSLDPKTPNNLAENSRLSLKEISLGSDMQVNFQNQKNGNVNLIILGKMMISGTEVKFSELEEKFGLKKEDLQFDILGVSLKKFGEEFANHLPCTIVEGEDGIAYFEGIQKTYDERFSNSTVFIQGTINGKEIEPTTEAIGISITCKTNGFVGPGESCVPGGTKCKAKWFGCICVSECEFTLDLTLD